MPIPLIGSGGDVPFNRTFFNVTLGEMLEKNGKGKPVKLTLFLTDATTLDVCMIDELSESYLAARAYLGESDTCELSLQLIPYGLIYRIEIAPKGDENSRVGFQWKPAVRKGLTTKRLR